MMTVLAGPGFLRMEQEFDPAIFSIWPFYVNNFDLKPAPGYKTMRQPMLLSPAGCAVRRSTSESLCIGKNLPHLRVVEACRRLLTSASGRQSRKNMGLFRRRILIIIGGIGLVFALTGCGGGSGDSDDSEDEARGKGTVGILLTDMPAAPDLFESINASIKKVELMGADDDDRVVLYSGPVRTFDLLRLRNESIPLTFRDEVPAGDYCKIRLTLNDLELVMADDTPDDPGDNDTHHPKLPGNGKLDLVARDCFTVAPGKILTLQVDIDANKSFHIVGNKKGFNFRPVAFVDVISRDFDAKLVRLTGQVTKIDADRRTLLLCGVVPIQNTDRLGCARILFGDDSAFFDNQEAVGYGGMPRPVAELLAADKLGQEITVVGWPEFESSPDDADESDSRHRALLRVKALVAELGEFLQVEGRVAIDADQDGFAMSVSSGGPILSADNLAVLLQPGGVDFNGTRIVSRAGRLLSPDDINSPLPVQVDGTLELIQGMDPSLRAALVVLDRAAANSEQITGVILALGPDAITLNPDAAIVCGVATDSLLVDLADDTEFLTVTITDDNSIIEPFGEPEVGQSVGMNGACGAGGYATDSVVIVDDQRGQPQ